MTQEQILGLAALTLLAAHTVGVVLSRRRPTFVLGRDVRAFGFLKYSVSAVIGLIVFLVSPAIPLLLLDFLTPRYGALAWIVFAYYFLSSVYLPLGALAAFAALAWFVEILRSRASDKRSVFSIAVTLGCAVGLLVTLVVGLMLPNKKGLFASLTPTCVVGGACAGVAIVRFLARPEKQELS